MNLIKRLKTLWIISGWDIKKSKKDGVFTIDGIIRPQIAEKPQMATIIKLEDDLSKLIQK